jgi:hypothetical protein
MALNHQVSDCSCNSNLSRKVENSPAYHVATRFSRIPLSRNAKSELDGFKPSSFD